MLKGKKKKTTMLILNNKNSKNNYNKIIGERHHFVVPKCHPKNGKDNLTAWMFLFSSSKKSIELKGTPVLE